MGFGQIVVHRKREIFQGFGIVLLDAESLLVTDAEPHLGRGKLLLCSFGEPAGSLLRIARRAGSVQKAAAEIILSLGVSLFGRFPEILESGRVINLAVLSVIVTQRIFHLLGRGLSAAQAVHQNSRSHYLQQ